MELADANEAVAEQARIEGRRAPSCAASLASRLRALHGRIEAHASTPAHTPRACATAANARIARSTAAAQRFGPASTWWGCSALLLGHAERHRAATKEATRSAAVARMKEVPGAAASARAASLVPSSSTTSMSAPAGSCSPEARREQSRS